MNGNRLLAALTFGILCAALSGAEVQEAETPRPEPTRIHYFGNSLTDELKYEHFKKLAANAGHPLEWKREMAPGVPVFFHWGRKKQWEKKLTENRWDVVTLQPFQNFELEYQACEAFARFLKEGQPDVQLYIYAQWPSRRSANWFADFSRPGEVAPKKRGWTRSCREKTGETYWLENIAADAQKAGMRARAERSLKNQYELTVQGLRARAGMKKPVKLIPVGHVMELLGSKMRAGQVPGYKTPHDLYSDGVHVNNVGSYIVACTFYATIFKTNPVGLPIGEYQANPLMRDDRYAISDELARIIQETAWEVVATHPLTGVTSDGKVKVGSASLEPAVKGEPCRAQLIPTFGKAPYEWRLASGTLLAGLNLDKDGVIRGTVTGEPGEYKLDIAVKDASGASGKRTLSLTVEPD